MSSALHSILISLGDGSLVDTSQWIDISAPVTASPTLRAFHLPPTQFEAFRMGTFVGSVEEGGPVRCDIVTVAPHGACTHTECVGHVGGKGYSVLNAIVAPLMVAELITVPVTTRADGDRVISRNDLEAAWPLVRSQALIIRTSPNPASKRLADHSGTNPAYVDVDAMRLIDEAGIDHVLIDVPSVDREEDGGAMVAHKTFWHYPSAPRTDRTITELIVVPDDVPDGMYALALNVAPFDADASPSRPMLARIIQRP
jgi:kynurenine formamidase